jgi:gas vesicle protein
MGGKVMADKEECCCGGGVLKIVVGGLVGAGLALLLAPQTGKKTRKYLSCCAKSVQGKANEAAYEFAENLSDFVDTAGDRVAEIFEEGAELTQESKKSLLAALEKGQQILEQQRKKLADMMG